MCDRCPGNICEPNASLVALLNNVIFEIWKIYTSSQLIGLWDLKLLGPSGSSHPTLYLLMEKLRVKEISELSKVAWLGCAGARVLYCTPLKSAD